MQNEADMGQPCQRALPGAAVLPGEIEVLHQHLCHLSYAPNPKGKRGVPVKYL